MLGAATVAMGLIAGLFYAFSCAVLPGLHRAGDATFVEAMQEINKAILNPVFALSFYSAPLLTAVAAWQQRRRGATPVTRWIVAGLVLYVLVFVITVAINVPLNNDLEDVHHAAARYAAARDHFEDKWVAWNAVRTVGSTVALACLVRAVMLFSRTGR